MIPGEYLVLLGTGQKPLRAHARVALPQLKPIYSNAHCLILVDGRLPTALMDEAKGAVLGQMHGPDARAFGQTSARWQAFPSWEAITRDNWGDYIVVDAGADGDVMVGRSAMGQLPCYHTEQDGSVILTNAPRIVRTLGIALEVDEDAVLRHLFNINARAAGTCLTGLFELEPGHCLTYARGKPMGVRSFWDPWRFAGKAGQYRDLPKAPQRLQESIIEATRKATAGRENVLLGLSGGLDSSILAASMAKAGVNFSCFTLVTPDGSGDERRYARAVAQHVGRPLHEIIEQGSDVDIRQSAAAHLPRPVARCFAQSGDKVQMALAQKLGADAFISGGGGDNSFCFVHSARPLADRLLTEGLGRGAWATARDIALLTDSPQWRVMVSAVRRMAARSHDYHWPLGYQYLSGRAQALNTDSLHHPWMATPQGELPGKAQHIAWILGVLNHIEGFGRERTHPTIWPLLSQPVVELCLSIPTWAWQAGGQNRVIARRAFADLLPPAILDRRSKGSPDSFVIGLFEERRREIGRFLCDGWLAAQGMIDVDAIAARCSRDQVDKDMSAWHLLRLVDAESWVRAWASGISGSGPSGNLVSRAGSDQSL